MAAPTTPTPDDSLEKKGFRKNGSTEGESIGVLEQPPPPTDDH